MAWCECCQIFAMRYLCTLRRRKSRVWLIRSPAILSVPYRADWSSAREEVINENWSCSDANGAHWCVSSWLVYIPSLTQYRLWVGIQRQGIFWIQCGYKLISIIETSANTFCSVKAHLGNTALFGMTADIKLSVTNTSILNWVTSISCFGANWLVPIQ